MLKSPKIKEDFVPKFCLKLISNQNSVPMKKPPPENEFLLLVFLITNVN